MKSKQLDLFDFEALDDKTSYTSPYNNKTTMDLESLFKFYDELNQDKSHFNSKDDECTPMSCVKHMIDYVPEEFWMRKKLRVLDPCAGNGNFPAYLLHKTKPSNIWANELSEIRYKNLKAILGLENVSNLDAFQLKNQMINKWDLIVANPPYSGGRNKNTSLSNQFIEESIDLLNDKGYLCFVTPNNWMTFNNNNPTLRKLLNKGSFLVIDNDVKKFFPKIGSSFTIFVWQKNVFNNKTYVVNNYLLKDTQENVFISNKLPFIPLYINQVILDLIPKVVDEKRNIFDYRCDLHNYTRKELLSDDKTNEFKYETIHTVRKTRFSTIKQDIFDKWTIIVPLSTYYLPYIKTKVNVTQSVGYISFDSKTDAKDFLEKMTAPIYRVFVHLTRYGNFNNIKLLRHLKFDEFIELNNIELETINKLNKLIKY